MSKIHYYASIGKLKELQEELAKVTDINIIDHEIGETPLHSAASSGQINVIKFLLEKDANIYALSKNNITPFHAAIDGLTFNRDLNPAKVETYYQIIELFLLHEKKLRLNNPEKYQYLPKLIDIAGKNNFKPLTYIERIKPEIYKKVLAIIEKVKNTEVTLIQQSQHTTELTPPAQSGNGNFQLATEPSVSELHQRRTLQVKEKDTPIKINPNPLRSQSQQSDHKQKSNKLNGFFKSITRWITGEQPEDEQLLVDETSSEEFSQKKQR